MIYLYIYLIGLVISMVIFGYITTKSGTTDGDISKVFLWPLFIGMYILISPFLFGEWLAKLKK